MADLHLLDDTHSATPLDLLLNAITGTGPYQFTPDDNNDGPADEESGERDRVVGDSMAAYLETASSTTEGGAELGPASSGKSRSRKRGWDGDGEEHTRGQSKIARKLISHLISKSRGKDPLDLPLTDVDERVAAAIAPRTFSTVTVWHPRTGQKSYGKERRIIQPPPTLRVSGPLFTKLTSVTLSAHPNPDPLTGPMTFSNQSHIIPLVTPLSPPAAESISPALYKSTGQMRKLERDQQRKRLRDAAARTGWGGTLPWERNRAAIKEREALAKGLSFPGLWIGEETGKSKEFRLELSLGQPGAMDENASVDNEVQYEHRSQSDNRDLPLGGMAPAPEMDEVDLREALGAAVMEPLSGLDTGIEETSHLVHQIKAASNIDQSEAQLTVSNPSQAPTSSAAPRPWATFVSDPLTIVSKPSQKTAKARSLNSCLCASDAFALWVRVNAQTVRTKYMKLDGGDTQPILAARTGKWTPFRFEVIHRASPPELEERNVRGRFKLDLEREIGYITYGSIVALVDVETGVRSDPVKLVRVDKNEVVIGAADGHPVSELQRVGLVRMIDGQEAFEGGSRWYLSAPGAVVGAGEVNVTRARPVAKTRGTIDEANNIKRPEPPDTLNGMDNIESSLEGEFGMEELPRMPTALSDTTGPLEAVDNLQKRPKKTKRHALARAAIVEEEQGSTQAALVWARSIRRDDNIVVNEGKTSVTRPATLETVDDWMCWVLGGVSCFQYTFFDGVGEEGSIPRAPLNPVPRLLVEPVFRPEQNTLELTLSGFFATDPDTGTTQPLDVYLGPIGPLPLSTWRSTAPKESQFNPGASHPALPYNCTKELGIMESRRVYSNFPSVIPHVIVVIEMPDPEEIVHVMNDCITASQKHVGNDAERDDLGTGEEDHTWLGIGSTEELTIHEALRHANAEANKENVVEDITTALGTDSAMEIRTDDTAGASDRQQNFEIEHLAAEDLDPSLTASRTATFAVTATAATSIAMHRPERTGPKEGGVPLPILLVRADGVGHGTGWYVVVEHDGVRVVQLPEREEQGSEQA